MTDSNTANMICPKCKKFQAKAESCKFCGIVIAKLTTDQTITQTSSTVPGNTPTPGRTVARTVGGPALFERSLDPDSIREPISCGPETIPL